MSVYRKIQRYLHNSGMSPTTFGRMVAGDPRLVHDLRNGREPRPRMTARIEAFLATRQTARPPEQRP